MPIRRPRGPKPALRHLAFLEAMSATTAESPAQREARAAFLVLRQLDNWVAYGSGGGSPTERSTDATGDAVRAIADDAELRAALDAIARAIPEISDADPQPVLPRVFALGSLLEQRGRTAQAADVYTTVVRHVDPVAHLDLAYDASMRQAACLRQEGELDFADQSYTHAGTLAARIRDRSRVLTSRVGRAKVVSARGNLPEAARALAELELEAQEVGATDLVALILHERAGVAHSQGEITPALRFVWKAFCLAVDEYDRERMLWDIANYLGLIGAEETARDALQLIAHGTRHQSARLLAYQNLMDLARRTGNELEFHQYRKLVTDESLPAPRRVSFLLDVGTGYARFGDPATARTTLTTALSLAESVGLNQRVFQIEELLRTLEVGAPQVVDASETRAKPGRHHETPPEIRDGLRELLQGAGRAPAVVA